MVLLNVSKLKVRQKRKKRKKRAREKAPAFCKVKIAAWLTRCATMGYEIWSEEPQLERDGCFRLILTDKENSIGGFYFRVPSVDNIDMGSPLYLHQGRTRRIWLHIDITGRKRLTDAEIAQASEDNT